MKISRNPLLRFLPLIQKTVIIKILKYFVFSALEKEQDMPIEELLKLYYNKPPGGEEQTNNGDNPQQPEEQVSLHILAFCFDKF